MTRMEVVKQSAVATIEAISKSHPCRAAVITFGSDVVIMGDGTKGSLSCSSAKINDYDALLQTGARAAQNVGPISESKESVLKVVKRLSADGSTALGPGVVCALGLCQSVPGSNIIVLTDGEACAGLGSLGTPNAADFYNRVGEQALNAGVSISIVGVRGATIQLETVGRMASVSGGRVSLADNTDLEGALSSLASKVVGSNVQVTLRAINGVHFVDNNGNVAKVIRQFSKFESLSHLFFSQSCRPFSLASSDLQLKRPILSQRSRLRSRSPTPPL